MFRKYIGLLEYQIQRLMKTEGAEAIRIHGDMDIETILEKRKSHHENWTDEDICECTIQLQGEHWPEPDTGLSITKKNAEFFCCAPSLLVVSERAK